jgi:hypothetical protein
VQPWPGSAINIMEVGAEALSSVISLSLTKFLLGDLVFRVKSGLTGSSEIWVGELSGCQDHS